MAIPPVPSIVTRLGRYIECRNAHFRLFVGVVLLVITNLSQAQQFSRADEWVVSVPLNFPPYYSINGDENPDGFAIDHFRIVEGASLSRNPGSGAMRSAVPAGSRGGRPLLLDHAGEVAPIRAALERRLPSTCRARSNRPRL